MRIPVLAWYAQACEVGTEPNASNCLAVLLCFLRRLRRVYSESDLHIEHGIEHGQVCTAFRAYL